MLIKKTDDTLINETTVGFQRSPQVTSLTNGGYIVIWESFDPGQSDPVIMAQVFDENFEKVGSEIQITPSGQVQKQAFISDLQNGEVLLVWQQTSGAVGAKPDVYGQKISYSASKIGDTFRINTETQESQGEPVASKLLGGGFVVVWTSEGQDGSEGGVFGQIFNDQGSPSGVEFQVNEYVIYNQSNPVVTSITDDHFVVLWRSSGSGLQNGIYGQIFFENGQKFGSEFLVSDATNSPLFSPSVTSLVDGSFVVVWSAVGENGWSDGGYNIYGRKYSSSGVPITDEFLVNSTISGSQVEPFVSYTKDGGFIVTWTDETGFVDERDGISARLFNNDTLPVGEQFFVNDYFLYEQESSVVGVSLSPLNSDFIVVWQSRWQDGSEFGVFGKSFEIIANSPTQGSTSIIGVAVQDSMLVVDTSALSDIDGLGTFFYQWLRDGAPIGGATADTYQLRQDDVDAAISVTVSYTDGYGAEESVNSDPTDPVENVNDSPTGVVVILGTATQGETLTADASGLDDPDGLDAFSYQWLRDGSPITGANAETYVLTHDDVGAAISVTVSYTDGFGANEVVSGAATDPVASSIDEFTSIVTTTLLDRFGQVISNGAVAVREMDGGPEVFVREVSDDTASGTVFEIVVQPSTDISALDFEFLDNAGLVNFQVSQALADWTTQTNSSVTDQVIFSGFGAPDGSLALPAGEETVVGRFETASDVDFDLAGIFLNGTSAEAISVQDVALDAQQNNVFSHSVANGADAQVAADRALDVASENAIGAFDALQALRLAVGLTKSDGTAEWHDYFAADINQDGRVGADDALNILKFAVGLTDGPSADWVFVDGDADYSDVTRQNSGYSEGMLQTDVTADTSVNLIGILVGDVDGSYFA